MALGKGLLDYQPAWGDPNDIGVNYGLRLKGVEERPVPPRVISRRAAVRPPRSVFAGPFSIDDYEQVKVETQPVPPFTDTDLVMARVYGVSEQDYRYPPGHLGDFQAVHCVRLPDKVVVLVAIRDDYAVVEDERHLFPSDELVCKLRMLI